MHPKPEIPGQVSLREMRPEDLAAVARIHFEELPEDFCSRMGGNFLESSFYPHFLEQTDGVGLVAVDREGEIRGFVIGAAGHAYYAEFFRKRMWSLATAMLGSLLSRPSLLGYYLEVARVIFVAGFEPDLRDAELLYIAIDHEAQGQSLGSRLTQALLAALSGPFYDRCVVKTLATTPENVRFYRRLGFEVFEESQGRVWLAHPLPQEAE